MKTAAWTALLTAGIELITVIESAIEDGEALPLGDADFDQAVAFFQARQAQLGQRFEQEMLRLKEEKRAEG